MFSVLVVRFVASSGNTVLFFSTLVFEISFLFISGSKELLSVLVIKVLFFSSGSKVMFFSSAGKVMFFSSGSMN